MVNVIVPLAGPEYFGADNYVKGLQNYNGAPALRHILEQRHWARQVSCYSFVMRDLPQARDFAKTHLLSWFPNSNCVFLSRETKGALPSALSGAGIFFNAPDVPLIVDLADIDFTVTDCDISELFHEPHLGGVIPAFYAADPCYSYMAENDQGQVTRTAEKQVISDKASAGCYLFRSLDVFLQACQISLNDPETYCYNGLYYLCPSFNAVIAQNYIVKTIMVDDVVDVRTG